jgi:RNA polymerase sigma-70 factor (ECF subfamily)
MVPIRANGQPAAAHYRRGNDGLHHAHALHVLTAGAEGVLAAITVFLNPELFAAFGLPETR